MEQRRARTAGVAALLCLGAWEAHAQPRPDAGTLQEPQRLIPALPPPAAPRIGLPTPPAPAATAASARILPAAFRFEGNTAVPTATLQALVAPAVGKPTDLAGLQRLARRVQEHYQDLGYLLTQAYIPEQELRAEGGTVTIAVVEARVGRVELQFDGPALPHAQALVLRSLRPGDLVSEDALDRPVLLLRDLAGHEATALVQPGQRTGEVDVRVQVRSAPAQAQMSLGMDNHGLRAAGRGRAFATVDVLNPSGRGDQLSARAQLTELDGNRLLRLSYTLPVGDAGTRASFSAARADYALGDPFRVLGAQGRADIFAAALLHPLQRTRLRNVYGLASLEHKRLRDELTAVGSDSRYRIDLLRLGALGNRTHELEAGQALTSYAASLGLGRLSLDAAARAADALPGGLGLQGAFAKANLELQHTHPLGGPWSLHGAAQGQRAFGNLASAEKMTLGGPSGVRAYPMGEAAGDSGLQLTAELRHQFTGQLGDYSWPATAAVFLDWGRVRSIQEPPAGTAATRRELSAAGISLQMGRPGKLVASAALAWRVGREQPSGGEPDRSPRLWLTIQGWF